MIANINQINQGRARRAYAAAGPAGDENQSPRPRTGLAPRIEAPATPSSAWVGVRRKARRRFVLVAGVAFVISAGLTLLTGEPVVSLIIALSVALATSALHR